MLSRSKLFSTVKDSILVRNVKVKASRIDFGMSSS